MTDYEDDEPFLCPLSLNIMEDPVIDPEGNTYERTAIESWLNVNKSSPITRSHLTSDLLSSNKALKAIIERLKIKRSGRLPPTVVEEDVTLDRQILGCGSFGVVRSGRWRGTPVAIKTLVPDAAETSPALLAGLERELKLLTTLRHANVIALYGHYHSRNSEYQSGSDVGPGVLHLVLELGEGGCLSSFMSRRNGPLPTKMVMRIAVDICRGLWYLHAQKVIRLVQGILSRHCETPEKFSVNKGPFKF
jgi:hypothetical protein